MKFVNKYSFLKFYSILLVFSFLSCGNSPKIIDNKDLKSIMYDITFSDIMMNEVKEDIKRDTTNFIKPILNKYGYEIEDFKYTIDKLVSRKSNVLPTLVSELTDEIKELKLQYNYKAEILKEWDNKADSLFTEQIYLDSLKINNLDSLDKSIIKLNLDKTGELKVKAIYKIDSTDKNRNFLFQLTLKDTISGKESKSEIKWLNKYVNKKDTRNTETIDINYNAKEYNQAILNVYNILKYTKKKDLKTPNVTFDTILVTYHYPKLTSRRMLLDSVINLNKFKNQIKSQYEKKDSSPLSVYIK